MNLTILQFVLLGISYAAGLSGALVAMLKHRNMFLWCAATFAVPLSLVVLLLLPELAPPVDERPRTRAQRGEATSREVTQPFLRRGQHERPGRK